MLFPGAGRGPSLEFGIQAASNLLTNPKPGWVYLIVNRRQGAIYTGSTSNLVQRVWQHRGGVIEGFTKKHGCTRLAWFEPHDDIADARQRELRIKDWQRAWKIRLIEEYNPDWRDLWWEIAGKTSG